MIRKCAVKGQFYPGNIEEYKTMSEQWQRAETIENCQTIIIPHAGYIYSGQSIYQAITAMDFDSFDRIVLIGPSHLSSVQGLSIFPGDEFETIGGTHPIDKEYSKKLADDLKLTHLENAHLEHSTEISVPILHELHPDMPVVECVYGGDVVEELFVLMAYLQEDARTAVIVSTDLSHFHPDNEARAIDANAVEAVKEMNPEKLLAGAEACGMLGLVTLLAAYNEYESRNVFYQTSADSPYGNPEKVVGYLSACLVKK